jgi:hypothetical protein
VDQNQDQNTNVTSVSDDGGNQPITSNFGVAAEPAEVQALSLDPQAPAQAYPEDGEANEENRTSFVIRMLKRADVILVLLLVVGLVGLIVANVRGKSQNPSSAANVSEQYDTVTLPLDGFVTNADGISFGDSSVIINGGLRLNDGLIVAPTVQPNAPVGGQMYFDTNTNQLAYYNGTAFVPLTAQGPVVQSIGGLTGALTIGGGLSIVGNQLISQTPGLDTNKVTSLGGLRGDITVGSGLRLAGNDLQNAGVLNVIAGTNISVTNDGNGNYTVNNIGAGTGTVTSPGGSNGAIAMFNSSQNIVDSLISQSGTTVSITGDLNVVTGGLSLGNALTVSNGGTGVTSLASNGVVVSNGTAAFSSVVAGAPGLCLLSTAGSPAWGACPGNAGVNTLNGLSGVLTIANASGAGATITLDDATTSGAKGIASFNSTNFTAASGVVNTIQDINTTAAPTFGRLTVTSNQAANAMLTVNNTNVGATGNLLDLQLNGVSRFSVQPGGNVATSGTINGQTISSSASFTGTLGVTGNTTLSGNLAVNGGALTSTGPLAVTPGGALTVGASAQSLTLQGNGSSTIAVTGGGNTTTISFQAPGANVTYRVPTAAAGTYDLCTTAGNCVGGGGGVTTPGGATNRLAKFTGSQVIGDSTISDNGSLVSTTVNFAVQGGTATIGVANSQTGSLVLALGSANFSGTVVPGALTANRTYTLPDADGTVCLSSGNCLGGGSGGANTALSNLTSVAINTSLLPGNTTVDLGSATAPFRNLYIAGSSLSPGTNNFQITGTATAARTITLPDSSGTVCLNNSTNCGFLTGTGTAFVQNGNTLGQTAVLGTTDTFDLNLITDGQTRLTLAAAGSATFAGNLAINGMTLSSAGALNITPAGTLTAGATNQALTLQGNASTVLTATGGGFTTTVGFTGTPAGAVRYNFDRAAAVGTYTICTTAGNCVGGGGGVTTPGGATNRLAKFTGSQTIGDSSISDDGTNVTTTVDLIVQGGSATVGIANSVTGTLILADGAANFTGSLTQGSLTANRTYTLPDADGTVCLSSGNCLGGGGGGANTALSNLSSVAINTSLLPGSTTIDLGSSSAPFRNLFIAGSSVTPSANNFQITGTATAARTITLPDATGTVCLTGSASCGFATGSGSAFLQNGNTFGATAVLGTNDNNGLNLRTNGTTAFALNTSGDGTLSGNLTINGSTLSSAGALSISPGSSLTVGATAQLLTLQGNASSVWSATGGGFTTTIGFSGSPTANVNYNFDRTVANGTYTICTSIGNCAGSGSGVTTAGGTNGTIAMFTGTQAIGDSLLSQSAGTVTVAGNLNLTTGNTYRINGVQVSSADLSNDANLAKLNASQTFSGATVTFQNASVDSTNAFNIQNTGGNRVLTADTTNGQIILGTGSLLDGKLVFNNVTNGNTVTIVPGTPSANRTITLPDASGIVCLNSGNCAGAGATLQTAYNFSAGGTTPKVKLNNTLNGFDIQDADTTIGVDLFNVRASNGSGLGAVMFGIGNTGQATFQNSANSTTAVNILTQGGTRVLTVDTQNGQTILGQSTTLGGSLVFSNATNSNQITVVSAVATAARTITLPDATGTVCLTTGNCAGAGTGVTTSGGTTDRLAKFTGSQAIGDSNISDNGSLITVGTTGVGVLLEASNAGGINIGSSANAHTINVGTGAAAQSVTLGSTNATSTTLIQGGSGNITLNSGGTTEIQDTVNIAGGLGQTGGVFSLAGNAASSLTTSTGGLTITGASTSTWSTTTGTLTLQSTNGSNNIVINGGANTMNLNSGGTLTLGSSNTSTVNVGAQTNNARTINVGFPTSTQAQTVNIGATAGASTTLIQAGTGHITLNTNDSAASIIARSSTNSATAFQIQDAGSAPLFVANTVARSVGTAGNYLKVGNSTGTDTDLTLLQLDSTTADPTTNLASMNGGLFYNSTTGKVSLIENGQVKIICNTVDLGCGTGTVTLQNAYANSAGGTTSEIIADATRGALDIQDRSTANGGTIAANLLNVRGTAANDSTAGASLFSVTSTGRVGIGIATPNRYLDVATNDTNITQPAIRLQQAGTGDATIELNTSATSIYLGIDNSDGGTFKISSTAANGATITSGITQNPTNFDAGNQNMVSSTQVTTAASAGTLNSINVYFENANGNVQVALYADTGSDAPGALLATSGQQAAVEGWNTFAMPSTALTGTTKYWIGFNTSSSTLRYGYINTGLTAYQNVGATFGTWPSPFGTPSGTSSSTVYLVNLTYTPSGAVDSFSGNLFSLTSTGAATFKNSTNSNVALQVQNSSGFNVLAVDTAGGSTANLIANPGFERNSAGWASKGSPSAFTTVTSRHHSGHSALYVEGGNNANAGARYAVTLSNSTRYIASFYAMVGTDDTNMTTLAAGYSSDGTTDNTACTLTPTTLVGNGWTRVDCTFTTPASNSGSPFFYVKQTDASNRDMFFDDFFLAPEASSGNTNTASNGAIDLQGPFSSPVRIQSSHDMSDALTVRDSKATAVLNVSTIDTGNMVTNPSFELNATSWSAVGGSTAIARDTSQSYVGNAALSATTSATANAGAAFTTGNNAPTVLAINTQYTLSWFAKLSGGSFTDIKGRYSRNGGTNFVECTPSAQTVSTSGWTRFTCTFTTDGTTASSNADLRIVQTAATARTFWIDGVRLEPGSTAKSFGTGTLSMDAVIDSPVILRNKTDSTMAFNIQDNSGVSLFNVDTLSRAITVPGAQGSPFVNINVAGSQFHVGSTSLCGGRFCVANNITGTGGSTYTNLNNITTTDNTLTGASVFIGQDINITDTGSTYANTIRGIRIDTSSSTNTLDTINSFHVKLPGTTSDSQFAGNALYVQNGSADVFKMTNTGATTLQNTLDSANALQVKNAAGVTQFNINDLAYINEVRNGDFEQAGVNGWTPKGTADQVWTEDGIAKFGLLSMHVRTLSAANNGAQYSVGLKPSTQYTLSMWVRRASGSAASFNIGRADNGTDTDCLTNQTFNTTYTQFTCTFTTGATIGGASSIYVKQTDTSTDEFYVDGVTLVRGATAQSYQTTAAGLEVAPYYNQVTLNGSVANPELQPWQLNHNDITTNGTTAAPRSRPGVATYNGYMYVLGGGTGTDGQTIATTNNALYAKINADGTVGAFAATSNLNTSVSATNAIAINGYMYVVGGKTANSDTTGTTVVQYAKINSDGTLGTWSAATAGLPGARSNPGIATNNGFLYVTGGIDTGGNGQDDAFYAHPDGTGNITSWTSNLNSLPTSPSGHGSFVHDGYLYTIGSNLFNTSTINYAQLNANGSIGTWVANSVNLPSGFGDAGFVAYNGNAYIIGGWNGSSILNTVYSAPFESEGTIGNWTSMANTLPRNIENNKAVVTNGYIYTVGGDATGASVLSDIYYTSGPRTRVTGALDLVGTTNKTLTDGSSGGQLTAGDTNVVGTLAVLGNASFKQNLSVIGDINAGGWTGGGLTDCDAYNVKLQYDATTRQFSCATDSGSFSIRKTSDENLANSTGMQADNSLTFAIGANETYTYQFNVNAVFGATGSFKYEVVAPSGATCNYSSHGMDTGGGSSEVINGACGTDGQFGGADTTYHLQISGTVTTGATPGNVTLQWAQVTSNGTNTTVKAGSSLNAFKGIGVDLAEAYYTNDGSIRPGDIVEVDGSLKAGVKKTQGVYSSKAMGIISTRPGHILSEAGDFDGSPVMLALSGRVPVRVSMENGPIEPGDYLTSSSTPGVAMKATQPGQMIGKALEAYDSSNTSSYGTVLTFANLAWANPATGATGNNDIQATNGSFANLNVTGEITTQNLTVAGTTKTKNLVVGDMALTKDLTVTGTASFAGDINLTGVGQSRNAITKRFKASAPIQIGSVVIVDPANDGQVTTTNVVGDTRVLGIALTEAHAAGDEITVAIGGSVQVRTMTGASIQGGDLLITSSQPGVAEKSAAPVPGSMVGKSLGKPEGDLTWLLITLN